MRSRFHLVGFGSVIVGLMLSAGASAAPVITYSQLVPSAQNALTEVQAFGAPSCPIGSLTGNCLANGPLDIDSASVMVDLGSAQVLDLDILVEGPGVIDFDDPTTLLTTESFKGYQKIVFTDATFGSIGTPANIGMNGNFVITGSVMAAKLEIFLAGNLGAVADLVVLNYVAAPNQVSGRILNFGDQIEVELTGVEIGNFPDIDESGNMLDTTTRVRAEFAFTAAIPEPGAAVLYGVGLLIAGASVRRQPVRVAR